ncbi:MAG: glutamate dehydrogenase [Sulfurimonas sp. RIFOXYD12_FULL_33_39]|uniref:NADP-specific glutamate dehydrogenase n=1 Tax=unclassified Sulfurimonas TaxID=2623549 RepID=UPI0008C92DC4|nr:MULTISPECIES: NADP-specific glutamate dehydrogenase [unclassified Sulfurimonas]OHE06806.1 MAG: glutamate dehydrogenase [Sulfurimonas sp. RIFCSPLOWO2_12_FULL_34_6]OHE09116.1 MAG: glutamate dehydrogenase [Sulfurimonas sp. RIFOXYD12_FULL_33_39]OHE14433.1 MAG: glutamate dehydrogenase [Sulfurimonas sp. RIFOXYD2_FULL_34_21]DAB28486.1 MAG TPA: NADP-specific glutamate dehydrogenase [Sulfurimonas sp. UBA10385]
MSIVQNDIKKLETSNCDQDKVFYQAMEEVIYSISPLLESDEKYKKYAVLERLVVPDRVIKFKVTWLDDNNNIQVNTGYRVQFNNALGPYKGGLRFHPSVNEGILKFLGFEQILKNALTGLPIGGAKGGSDFDPKGKSDFEIMKFCSAFMTELHKYIGPRIDVPAGDIGVGSREIGYLFGEYKKITSSYDGVLTGKPYMFGGSLMRPEATGYGVVYFTQTMLDMENKESLVGKICTVSGAGNVALHVIEKLLHIGAIPVSCSDSQGTIYDSRGVDLELLKELKLEKRVSLERYIEVHTEAKYIPVSDYNQGEHAVWNIQCYAAFPCATQNELTELDALNLIANGCTCVSEGANMPSTPEAIDVFLNHQVCFAPAKAANAGGVAVSEFEMSQNASMQRWSFEKVDSKLKNIMQQICKRVVLAARDYGVEGNYVDGANIAGFKKVADAMIAEGI